MARLSVDDELKTKKYPATWVVIAVGSERQYGGNAGYDDDPGVLYRWDSLVGNSRRIGLGDYLAVRNEERLLGIGRISRLEQVRGEKLLRRCPKCDSTKIKVREKEEPKWRCECKNTFSTPVERPRDVVNFTAHFDGSFVPAKVLVGVAHLRSVLRNYNPNLSMQQLDDESKEPQVAAIAALRKTIVVGAVPPPLSPESSDTPHVPNGVDERELINRQIRARRGQASFRKALRELFGETCVISGCTVLDCLEAAHIAPYLGTKDNHPSNGLLLRADIHTLFDLDLIGIEPKTLEVHVHKRARRGEYASIHGSSVAKWKAVLSQPSLELRWKRFCANP